MCDVVSVSSKRSGREKTISANELQVVGGEEMIRRSCEINTSNVDGFLSPRVRLQARTTILESREWSRRSDSVE